MKKFFLLIGFILFCSMLCFAEEEKYRYLMITDNAIMIADFPIPMPDEMLSDKFLSVNTKREQMEVEYGLKNVQSYFYSGELVFVYADYTEDLEHPDMSYIDTWNDIIAYIRGNK